mmetsp:Transcript_1685/g.3704  ORF Transcript_1685/g.3704 Transcript_1685/m.3704 type:complete len:318 (+) Transcript_1685:878-1831(+)
MAHVNVELIHLRQDWRRRSCCGHHELDFVGPGLSTSVLEHGAHHDRGSTHMVCLVLFNGVKDILSNHLSEANVKAGNRRDGVDKVPTVAVEHGQGPQVACVPRHSPLYHIVHAHQVPTAMVQQNTLGVSCGAAGVAKAQRIPLVLRWAPSKLGISSSNVVLVVQVADWWSHGNFRGSIGVVDIHQLRPLGLRHKSQCCCHVVAVLSVHDQDLGLCVFNREGDCSHIEAVIQRAQHSTRHRDSMVGLEHLWSIVEHHSNNFSSLDAFLLYQNRGQLPASPSELCICAPERPMDNGNPLGKDLCRALQQQERRQGLEVG